MGIELMEIKIDGNHYEFILRETVMDNILDWQSLPSIDAVKEYLKKHPFPKDKLYSEKDFLDEAENNDRYIHLLVEKKETAEFIYDLCYALI